jgi:hypothetical protein
LGYSEKNPAKSTSANLLLENFVLDHFYVLSDCFKPTIADIGKQFLLSTKEVNLNSFKFVLNQFTGNMISTKCIKFENKMKLVFFHKFIENIV